MCPSHSEVDLGFTDRKQPAGTHMCLIFQDENERRKIMAKFIRKGLSDGEKVAYYADVMTPKEVVDWLQGFDINVTGEMASNNLVVQDSLTTYCPNGKFVPDEMLEQLKAFYLQSIEEGYTHVRASGEMSWALKGIPGSERLIEYEAWLNVVFQTHPVTGICQYDANKFSGALIMDVLKVHPMMIVKGNIVHNPYYLTLELFLKELSTRSKNKAKT